MAGKLIYEVIMDVPVVAEHFKEVEHLYMILQAESRPAAVVISRGICAIWFWYSIEGHG